MGWATGRQQAAFTGTPGRNRCCYLADGVTLVAADRSGQLHLWDAQSGRSLVEAWQAHAGSAWRIAVHPDGQRFVTTGDDGRVKIWDQLSVARACEIGAPAFDARRRNQYLGEGEQRSLQSRTMTRGSPNAFRPTGISSDRTKREMTRIWR